VTVRYRSPLLEIVDDDRGLAALGGEWDRLLADADHPSIFQSLAWMSSWRATLGREHRLMIGVGRDPDRGELVGLAPFAVTSRYHGPAQARVLQMAGSGPAAPDHLDLIVRRGHPHIPAALWSAIEARRDWDLVDLDGLRSGSHLAGLLLRRRTDLRSRATATVCPYLPLPSTWEEYQASLGKNLRQNLRRYRRKLDDLSPGRVVERMVVDADEVVDTVGRLADLHQQVRTARGDRGSFADPAMIDFHRRLALRLLEEGRLRMHRLDVDGRIAAAISCFRYDATVSFYTTGYDPGLAAYGPGRRLMALAIRSAIGEGAAGFDFLRGDEPYKRSWGAVDRHDQRIRFATGPRGRLITQARQAARPLRLTVTLLRGTRPTRR
jgi:CelD/BcsL family acetyltransferase involved in cellulose biosynthesis